MSLGIYIICKDEMLVIERILRSIIDVVDQVVVTDTGSTDGTLEYLLSLKNDERFNKLEVYQFEWNNNFSDARNFAMSKINTEYAMWLDSDDIINEETRQFLLHFDEFAKNNSVDMYTMRYLLSRNADGTEAVSMKRERISKVSKGFKWVGAVHEVMDVINPNESYSSFVIDNKYYIEHDKKKEYTDRNLRIYKERIKNGEILSGRDNIYYGNELYYNGYYDEAYKQLMWCVLNETSWYADMIDSCIKLSNITDDTNKKYTWLMTALKFGPGPRPDVICLIADWFKDNGDNQQAIAWYELAYKTKFDKTKRSDIIDDKYSTWYPCLMLSVLYWDIDKNAAKIWHEYGISNYPNNQYLINNNKFFI